MPYAPVNGTEIYYEVHGSGPPLILAHGAGGNHLSWWQQVPVLSERFRCITFDHRGWGLTPDRQDLGPAAFIHDLAGLMEHLEIEKAVHVGQSMGGFTCLGLALTHPDRVEGLIMANTFAGMRREVWLAAPETVRHGAQEIWERRRATGVRRALSREFTAANRHLAFLYKQIRQLNEHGPNRVDTKDQITRLRALERIPDSSATREALGALGMQVLFIGGEHDEVMPVTLMEIATTLVPASRMVTVAGAAHSVYFEAPDEFNRLVLEFALNVTES